MQKKIENTGVVVLAGGRSSRMGVHKAFLSFDHYQTFLDRLVVVYSIFGIERIIVVLNDTIINANNEYSNILKNERVIVVKNSSPEKGRLFSIRSGLKEVLDMDHVFLQNIDNPFTDEAILRSLLDASGKEHYCAPLYNGRGGHPILFSGKMAEYIVNIGKTNVGLREILRAFTRKNVPINDHRVLVNINTPEEYSHQFGNGPVTIQADR